MRNLVGLVVFVGALGFCVSAVAGWEDAESCYDASEEAKTAAEELSSASTLLAGCADTEDLSDDCSVEYDSVTSAHSDYESAVSDVSSYCE